MPSASPALSILRIACRAWAMGLLLAAGALVAAENYRGFSIDDAAVQGRADREAVLTAIRSQIDIVHAVGLPPETVAFMAKVRFEIVPLGTFASPTPGRYHQQDGGRIQVSTAILGTGRKPVLLHELLHAYHDQVVPRGYDNPEIQHFFNEARKLKAYAERSHMMKNDREFFACAATTFLNGVTAQEPFQRAKVREHQPELHAFLQRLLGPDTGRYAGSLER